MFQIFFVSLQLKMFNQIKVNSMLLVRVKETGTIAEVEPRIICGRYCGFRVVDSNSVYDYEAIDILSDVEIEAIKTLPEDKIDDSLYHGIKKLRDKLNSVNNSETLGAHIRNILSPYANIVQILQDVRSNADKERTEKIKNFLFNNIDPKELEENLNHFIDVSHLDEVERIDWRATKLAEEYYKKIE